MKKSFILVTILAVVTMLALGCAPQGAPAPAPPAPTPSPEEVTPVPTPPPEEVTPTPAPQPTPTAEWGILEIRVTDPPPADVESVVVTLTNIEVHREGAGWETIDIPEAKFDLMVVAEVEAVLGSANVTAGNFTQIRMDVPTVEVGFSTDNGTDTVTARVPNEKLRIVKAFEVVAGEKTALTLDFDGKKSLILPGKDIATGKERAIFKPVLHVKVEHSKPPATGTHTGPPVTGEPGEDTTPPEIKVSGVTDGEQYSEPVFPTFEVSDDTDPNPTWTATLNGVEFASGTQVSDVGEYELVVTAIDASGNEAEVAVNFEIVEVEDTTPPVISVIGVIDGEQYSGPVTPVFEVSDDTDMAPTVTATLNRKPFTSGTVVSKVGEYELVVKAKDASGNEAEVTVQFKIVEAK